jgi:hypothetical protein
VYPGERKILITHKHWATLASFLTMTLTGLVAAGALAKDANGNNSLIFVVWMAWGLILIYLAFKVSAWWRSYLVITDKRLIFIAGGLLVRRSASVHISKVTSWYLRDSLGGLLLRNWGYKTLVFKSDSYSKSVRTIGWIPLTTIKSIEAVLPSTARSEGDEEAFKEWAPGGLRRRLRSAAAVVLIFSLIILSAVVAEHPHIRSELGNQSDVIALLSSVTPIVITLITP